MEDRSYGTRSKVKSGQVQLTTMKLEEVDVRKSSGAIGVPYGFTPDKIGAFGRLAGPADALDVYNASREARAAVTGLKSAEERKPVADLYAQARNRQVIYPGMMQGEFHGVQIGNDIAATFGRDNSHRETKSKARVYAYDDLALKLDMIAADGRRENKHGEVVSYWQGMAPEMRPDQRRGHMAAAVQHFLTGDFERGQASVDAAGLNARGGKWLRKFATIQMAEQAREHHAMGRTNAGSPMVHEALENAVQHGFRETYTGINPRAAFATSGGAEEFRKRHR